MKVPINTVKLGPNKDPSTQPVPRTIEEEMAIQGMKDFLEDRPMDNLAHARAAKDLAADQDQIRAVAVKGIGQVDRQETMEDRQAAARKKLLGE